MKYSIELTWKAVEEFLPSFAEARQRGHNFNLPQSLSSAAEECFMIMETPEFKLNHNQQSASLVIRTALQELQTVGWMTFGDVNDYWE